MPYLSHSQLQTLLSIVREKISSLEEASQELKALKSYHYRKATPETIKGMIAFSYLKAYMNMYRNNKKMIKKYADLSRSIKKTMRSM